MTHQNILIVGGGPVGLSLALLLAKHDIALTLIEKNISHDSDKRVLALSTASYHILQQVDAWPHTKVNEVKQIDVSHSGFGLNQIKAELLGLEQLGFTLAYTDLCTQLKQMVYTNPLITVLSGEVNSIHDNPNYCSIEYTNTQQTNILSANLVVLAEGGKLLANNQYKQYDYQQQALIAQIEIRTANKYLAYEHFANNSALAILPYQKNHVAIWSIDNQQANNFRNKQKQFIHELNECFSKRFGGAKLLSEISSFPLHLVKSKTNNLQRVALIGNSAQVLHPISAQGLNLGLRDALELSKILINCPNITPTTLRHYYQTRKNDQAALIEFTHFLATKFKTSDKLLSLLRSIGLISFNNLPILQNTLLHSLIFGI